MENNTEEKMNLIEKIKTYFDKHKTLSEILRFLIVGGLATVIDFFVMGLVLYIFNPSLYPNFIDVFIGNDIEPSVVAAVVGTGAGFVISLIFNYIFSIIFVYKDKGRSKTTLGFVLFAVLSAVGLLIHLVGMWLGFNILGINEWIVKIILTLVVLVYNYLTRKFFIFRKDKEELMQKDN